MSVSQPLDQSEVRLFSGRSNPSLAAAIAENLGIELEKTHFSRFSNDNLFVQCSCIQTIKTMKQRNK